MQKIYIIISQTGTLLSNIIKQVTGDPYNHVSISLDKNLLNMYSFGRKYTYNPFIGVFVVEHINEGVYKRFKDTKCKIICVNVSDEQYNTIRCKLMDMNKEFNKYKYNLVGLILALFHIDINLENKFYCSKFVKYLLDYADVDVSMIPNIVHPVDFLCMNNVDILYEGLLSEYEGYQKKLTKF